MGGGCAECGYNRCDAALELHHLDPTEKEGGLGQMMSNPTSWEKLVQEMRKCVMLCSCCHKEVHAGALETKVSWARFNEEYADYSLLGEENSCWVCPVCHGERQSYNSTCSRKCAAKLAGKIDWDTIDLPALLVEHGSKSAVGRILGCSDVAVAKRLKKLQV